jgi:hypothetical protein
MWLEDFSKICEPLFLHILEVIVSALLEEPLILDLGLQKCSCLSANLQDGRYKQHEFTYTQHDGRYKPTQW